VGFAQQEKATDPTWEIYGDEEFCLIIPRGWRQATSDIQLMHPNIQLYLSGDGIGVPPVDETGEPLQIGLSVEKTYVQGSLEERATNLVNSFHVDPRLELFGKEHREWLELSDGTPALLLTTEFIKDSYRHSIHMKMLLTDQYDISWVVGGWVVGGKESRVPTEESELTQWLRTYILSFCFDCTQVRASGEAEELDRMHGEKPPEPPKRKMLLDQINEVILSGDDIDTRYANGYTLLFYAAKVGDSEAVKLLLKHGAQVNLQSKKGTTAVILAAVGGHVETIQLLLDHGADIATQEVASAALVTASTEGHIQVVQLLLEQGVCVTDQEIGGKALVAASARGHVQIVQLLLDQGADISSQDVAGTMLAVAAGGGHVPVLQLLLEQGVNVKEHIFSGMALVTAAVEGHTEVIQLLVNHEVDINTSAFPYSDKTALVAAAEQENMEMMQFLLKHGADVNGQTAMAHRTALIVAIEEGHTEMVRLLLKYGADVHIKTAPHNDTTLMSAAGEGHI
jgi:ankyrin repeat protein